MAWLQQSLGRKPYSCKDGCDHFEEGCTNLYIRGACEDYKITMDTYRNYTFKFVCGKCEKSVHWKINFWDGDEQQVFFSVKPTKPSIHSIDADFVSEIGYILASQELAC